MKTTTTRKIGTNRNRARLWLEGAVLTSNNWTTGTRFDVSWGPSPATGLPPVLSYVRNPNGRRKVAGTPGRPIIDTNAKALDAFRPEVHVTITPDLITVKPLDPADYAQETTGQRTTL